MDTAWEIMWKSYYLAPQMTLRCSPRNLLEDTEQFQIPDTWRLLCCPGQLIFTFPPSFLAKPSTASMPTPRPETSVNLSAVENPGRKINSAVFSSVRIWLSCISPLSNAFRRILFSGSLQPSSLMAILIWSPTISIATSIHP